MRWMCLCLLGALMSGCMTAMNGEVAEQVVVEPVWAGHEVQFDLLTAGNFQFVTYYDANRQLSVAQRKLGAAEWTVQKLDSYVEWDSHNYIVLAVDRAGCLHVSGNMHTVPLVYFRSEKPYDVTTLVPVHAMTGEQEDECTYPEFIKGANGELIFNYRDGVSGKGNQIYNIYDEKTRGWSRLLDRPLTDGEGKMNAYFEGPVLGPDGYFHVSWVWRDTRFCESNHDLSYARSRDLVHWETAGGSPLRLPVRLGTPGLIVDPVPVKQGMINGNGKIGFDSAGRVVLTYHKFDADGNTQLYNARYEEDGWKIYETSDWNYRWYFEGGGSIIFEIDTFPVEVKNGRLEQRFRHRDEGDGRFILDEQTLRPTQIASLEKLPDEVRQIQCAFPGMMLNLREDSGAAADRYLLRWETLPPNRDAPREGPLPDPTPLTVIRLSER